MKVTGNTILITGGASGIGLALAKRFAERENSIIICGRRSDKLAAAAHEIPGVTTRVCDIGDPAERIALAEWALETFPELNVLVNNAGIQRRVDLGVSDEDWSVTAEEIRINVD